MKHLKLFVGLAVIALLLTACDRVDFKKTAAGVPYKIFGGKGDKIVQGNILKYHVTYKIKDSVLNTTYTSMPKYAEVSTPVVSYEDPLMEIFLKARKGDSIYIVQSVDTFIAKNPMILQQTPFKKGDNLITTVRIVDVFKTSEQAQADFEKERDVVMNRMEQDQLNRLKNDPETVAQLNKDSKAIEDYLAKNNIQASKVGWGTYVEVQQPGTGAQIAKGKYVTMFYHGTSLEGKLFDSNKGKEPAIFQLLDGRLIRGFLEGLTQLRKGAKARLFVPSTLGYGPQGSPPVIDPNANLIFEVEILDVTDAPPAPKNAPQNHPDTGSHEGHNH